MLLDSKTQMELEKEDTPLQVSSCRECLGPITGACSLLACRRRAVVHQLCYKVKELWEKVTVLYSIRKDEKEMSQIMSKTLQLQEPEPSAVAEGQESLCL